MKKEKEQKRVVLASKLVININRFFFLLFLINRYLCLHLIVTEDIISFLECKICMIVSKLLCLNVSYLYNQEMNMNQSVKSLLILLNVNCFSTAYNSLIILIENAKEKLLRSYCGEI